MKRWLQFGAICVIGGWLFAHPVSAQIVTCKGPQESCAYAKEHLELYLDLADAPSGWTWVLLRQDEWRSMLKAVVENYERDLHSETAFAYWDARRVYINLNYFRNTTLRRALETVLHELAHITRCGKKEPCAIRETEERLRALGVKP